MTAPPLSTDQARRWQRVGALAALALLLGYLESFVPLPIPGVKLGLANIPILVALGNHDLRGACWIALVKVVATSLLFGNPVTLAYAATGTALALACMAPLSLLPTMRLEMVSVVGALAHEAGQLLVAQVLLGTPLVWYGAPVLALAGAMTGALCGVVAVRLMWLLAEGPAGTRPVAASQPATDPDERTTDSSDVARAGWKDVAALVAYVAFVIAAMHATSIPGAATCLALAIAFCLAGRVRMVDARRALAPALPIALVALVAQLASTSRGPVVAWIGPLALTREALKMSAVMIARLASITLASVAFVRVVGRSGLMRLARGIVAPLDTLGVDTQGPRLALATTVELLPLLVGDAWRGITPRDILTRDFWEHRLPTLVQELYERAGQNCSSHEGR